MVFYFPWSARHLIDVANRVGLWVGGMSGRAVPNRIRAAPQAYDNRSSRCLDIEGPEAIVNEPVRTSPCLIATGRSCPKSLLWQQTQHVAAQTTSSITMERRRKHQIHLLGTQDAASCQYDTHQSLLSLTRPSEAAAYKTPSSRPLVSHLKPAGFDCNMLCICTNIACSRMKSG